MGAKKNAVKRIEEALLFLDQAAWVNVTSFDHETTATLNAREASGVANAWPDAIAGKRENLRLQAQYSLKAAIGILKGE
jgi:hypothetical protein